MKFGKVWRLARVKRSEVPGRRLVQLSKQAAGSYTNQTVRCDDIVALRQVGLVSKNYILIYCHSKSVFAEKWIDKDRTCELD